MVEKLKRQQLEEYSAVPLDAWNATDLHTGEAYATSSTRRISGKLRRAMLRAVENGWVESADTTEAIGRFMEESLYATQMQRIDLNSAQIDNLVDNDDPRIIRAKEGVATPADLLGVLVAYPKLESLELAKLSHPFDEKAPAPMDAAVFGALDAMEFQLLDEDPRYKMKRVNETIPAGVALRKQAVAELATDNGTIQVVHRQSFLVRADEGASADPYLERKIKNPQRTDELGQKIEAYLPHLRPDLMWLQPQASSYYAKYLPEVSE